MTENEKNKMAVLIDSENVSSKNIEFIMKESIRHGFLTIKRIYGDWTDQRMTSWKKVLPDYELSYSWLRKHGGELMAQLPEK
jgi:hypothetical protein